MTQYWIDGPAGRSVCVTVQGGQVWATLYVGGGEKIITGRRWAGRTEAGARKWAALVLAA